MRRRVSLLPLALLLPLLALGACTRALTGNFAAWFAPTRPTAAPLMVTASPDARLAVTWIGHATALLQLDDRLVLTDPLFVPSVGMISPRLVEPGVAVEGLPRIDVAVVSHMHFDHLSPVSLELLGTRLQATLVPEGGLPYVPELPGEATELRWWQSWHDRGLEVTAVPVRHSGFRYGLDGQWLPRAYCGYVIRYHGLTVFFGGDTGYDPTLFRAIGERYGPIDLAVLPIAPVEPRKFMASKHIDPHEALQITLDLGARWMVPVHYDTFVNSTDRQGDALRLLRLDEAARGLAPGRVQVVAFGERRVLLPASAP
jgi:L-ascorbate metabolism protein UlaG (beta-lactamase superfamily)